MKQYKPRTRRMAQLVDATFSSINMPAPYNEIKVDRSFTPAIIKEELEGLGYKFFTYTKDSFLFDGMTDLIFTRHEGDTDYTLYVSINQWTFEIIMKGGKCEWL